MGKPLRPLDTPYPLWFITLALLAASMASPALGKEPPPPNNEVQQLQRSIREIFRTDLTDAKTREQKAVLVDRMFKVADEEPDVRSKYALLALARDTAIDAADLDRAMAAVDKIDETYELDLLQAKADAAIGLSRRIQTFADRRAFLKTVELLTMQALKADRFDLAEQLSDRSGSIARQTDDSALEAKAMSLIQQVRDWKGAYNDAKRATATLATKPDDAEANTALGRYLCFIQQDWEKGLPMLAAGSNAKLRDVARAELDHPLFTETRLKLADQWWDVATGQSPLIQSRIRAHAVSLYEALLPELAGLSRMRVEQRMQSVPSLAGPRKVDLLKLIDPKRDAVQGKFTRNEKGITFSGKDQQRIEIPYRPPEEYDYVLEFTRSEGNGCLIQMLSKGSTPFIWVVGTGGGSVFTFHYLKGAGDFSNATTVRVDDGLTSGIRHRSLVEVRNDGARAYYDGKLIQEWKTDYTDIDPTRPFWLLRNGAYLGWGGGDCTITVHAAEVIEISGKGQVVANP